MDHSMYDMRQVGVSSSAMVDDAEFESGRFAGEFGAFESVMHEEGLNSEMKVLVDIDLERIVAEVVAS